MEGIIPSSSLAQNLLSHLLHDSTTSSLASSYLLFFQRHGSTCGTFEVPISWLLLQILLFSLLHLKSPILLLLSSLPLFYSSFVFLFLFFFLLFSLLFSSSSFFSCFSTLIFFALVSTAFHIPLDISSFSPLLFSSQSQDCGEQAMAFSRSHSTFAPQSHQFLFSLYVSVNKYLPLLYVQ